MAKNVSWGAKKIEKVCGAHGVPSRVRKSIKRRVEKRTRQKAKRALRKESW